MPMPSRGLNRSRMHRSLSVTRLCHSQLVASVIDAPKPSMGWRTRVVSMLSVGVLACDVLSGVRPTRK